MNRLFLELTLDGDPVPKGRPRFRRIKNFVSTYSPAKTATYERELAILGSQQMEGRPPLECPVRVEVEAVFQMPSKKPKPNQLPRSDVDNLLKIVGDGLNQIVWKDDRQIVEANVTKVYGDKPKMIIRVFTANQIN